jgi:valyl-tRNA synthetase
MGHALNGSIQDALVRWHRMRGFNTLWQPGFDHAGIATQAVVEKELRRQGTSRQEIGRDAFVERVWEWLREYGGVIMSQFRRLGCSLDYERERFTMDEDYIRAVMRFFVHLYDRGLLYRDNRIINWCSDCRTSISDLEVEHLDIDDALTYTQYALADGEGHITIATVRPATILADVAVAVHPDDERYKHLIGKEVIVPIVERRVPVIPDARVKPDFGPGVLKITPGHDPLDFEIGRDHGCPSGGDRLRRPHDGRHPAEADRPDRGGGDYVVSGCARAASERELPALRRPRRPAHASSRSSAAVVVREADGRGCHRRHRAGLRHLPPTRAQQGRAQLAEGDPWNVSRQLWWGQLPIWYCPDGHVTCAETEPEACASAASASCGATQTFWTRGSHRRSGRSRRSAGRRHAELRRYYPATSTRRRERSSSSESRMIMAGLELMGDIRSTT